jgi:hypothetical protein
LRPAFSLSITLWISAVLIAGALFFIQNSKKNLTINHQLNDKLQASIDNTSHMSIIASYLFSAQLYGNKALNENYTDFNLSKNLRIDGLPFKYYNSTVTIQDSAGLINIYYINGSILRKYLKFYEYEESDVLKDSLDDWLDQNDFHRLNGAEQHHYEELGLPYIPRNSNYIVLPGELKIIMGGNSLFETLEASNFISTFNGGSNIATMPLKVFQMHAQIENEQEARSILELKEHDDNLAQFKEAVRLLPFSFESNFFPSNTLKITVTTQVNDTVYSSTQVIDLRFLKTTNYQ